MLLQLVLSKNGHAIKAKKHILTALHSTPGICNDTVYWVDQIYQLLSASWGQVYLTIN